MSPILNCPGAAALTGLIAFLFSNRAPWAWRFSLEGGLFRIGGKKGRDLPCERLRVLKEGAMTPVWIDEQDGVRQVLAHSVGVESGNHFVVHTVHHQRRLVDGP